MRDVSPRVLAAVVTISPQPTGALTIGLVSPSRRVTQGLTAMWVLGWVLVEASLGLELTSSTRRRYCRRWSSSFRQAQPASL